MGNSRVGSQVARRSLLPFDAALDARSSRAVWTTPPALFAEPRPLAGFQPVFPGFYEFAHFVHLCFLSLHIRIHCHMLPKARLFGIAVQVHVWNCAVMLISVPVRISVLHNFFSDYANVNEIPPL